MIIKQDPEYIYYIYGTSGTSVAGPESFIFAGAGRNEPSQENFNPSENGIEQNITDSYILWFVGLAMFFLQFSLAPVR